MTQSYINKIKANIGIYATKKATNVLDGTYTSIFTGRSMNFEDLRDYVPGDSMRDIEWKASTRSGKLLVKRFVAEKKHNMLFVMDTNLRMLGDTSKGEKKMNLALYSIGTLSYIAYKNGDAIGAAYYNQGRMCLEPFRTGINNIERLLTLCEKAVNSNEGKTLKENNDDISKLIEKTVAPIKKRMVIFIVTDMKGAASIREDLLKRLRCIHDILFIITDDAVVTGKNQKNKSFNLCDKQYIPAFIGENRTLIKMENRKRAEYKKAVMSKCKNCGISASYISEMSETTTGMIELLERHRYESKLKA